MFRHKWAITGLELRKRASFQETSMIQWAGMLARSLPQGIYWDKPEAHRLGNWLL